MNPYTDEQVDALNELHYAHGRAAGRHEVAKFIKEQLKLSEVHAISIEIRKRFGGNEIFKKYEELADKSGLQEALFKRLD